MSVLRSSPSLHIYDNVYKKTDIWESPPVTTTEFIHHRYFYYILIQSVKSEACSVSFPLFDIKMQGYGYYIFGNTDTIFAIHVVSKFGI